MFQLWLFVAALACSYASEGCELVTQEIVSAAGRSDTARVDTLLNQKVSPMYQGMALQQAVMNRDYAMAKLLVVPRTPIRPGCWGMLAQPDTNYCEDDAISAVIIWAITHRDVDMLRLLAPHVKEKKDVSFIERSVYVDSRSQGTAVGTTSPTGNAMLEVLINSGYPVGYQELVSAIRVANPELLSKFLKLLTLNRSRLLVITRALNFIVSRQARITDNRQLDVFVSLVEYPNLPQSTQLSVFRGAVVSGSRFAAFGMLQVPRLIPSDFIQKCLGTAVKNHRSYMASMLVKYGAKPTWDMFNNDFHRIVEFGSSECLQKIMDSGTVGLVSTQELIDDYTYASANHKYGVAGVLVPQRDINQEFQGLTLLYHALREGRWAQAARLINRGAKLTRPLDETYVFGNTLLHCIALSGDFKAVQRVIDAGADPSILNSRGQSFVTQLSRNKEDGSHGFHGKNKWFYNEATSALYDHFMHAHSVSNIVQNQLPLPLDVSRQVLQTSYGDKLASDTSTTSRYDLNRIKARQDQGIPETGV